MTDLVPLSANPLVPSDMDQAIRLAKAMSSAKMLPKHLWDDVGTCLMIIEQAMRWRMSPFAVAQCTSSIGGKLMFEGKLVAAAVEASGVIEGHFDYDFKGDGDDRQVTVSARRRGEANPRQMTIKLRDVRTTNEHWKKQPDQMLVYSSTRNWARRFAPSVILGVYVPEEFGREAEAIFNGTTIEAKPEPAPEPAPVRAAAAAMPASPRKKQTIADWLTALRMALHDATSAEECDHIMGTDEVRRARETFRNGAKDQLEALIEEAEAKWLPQQQEDDEELPDLAALALP